jgi:hypothetical protein
MPEDFSCTEISAALPFASYVPPRRSFHAGWILPAELVRRLLHTGQMELARGSLYFDLLRSLETPHERSHPLWGKNLLFRTDEARIATAQDPPVMDVYGPIVIDGGARFDVWVVVLSL